MRDYQIWDCQMNSDLHDLKGWRQRKPRGKRMKLDWSGGGLAEGLRCYRKEEFFAAHEHWEGVWLGSQEPEKTFLQAVIQVAAAFHHLQRGNPEGGRSLLRRALRRLGAYPASFGGIAVA